MRRALLLWFAYVCLLFIVAMPHGLHTAIETFSCRPNLPWPCNDGVLTPLSTNADIIRLFTTADAAFMAQHAKDFALSADWTQATGWPLWPPGMILLETFLYRFSPAAPVALVLIGLGCALWAGALAQMSLLMRNSTLPSTDFLPLQEEKRVGESEDDLRKKHVSNQVNHAACLSLPLLFLITPEFSYFFHRGLFYTESMSIAAFLWGIGLLAQAVQRRNAAVAGWAGCLFALSAYMRAQTDMVMSVTLLLWVPLWLFAAWRQKRLGPPAHPGRTLRLSAWLGALAVALVSYHALTLPYRAAHGMRWIDMVQSPVWPPTWERGQDITPVLQFYADGGGVVACAADPERCDYIHDQRKLHGDAVFGPRDYFHFTVASVLRHPLNWAALKYPYLCRFWMEAPWEGALLSLLLPVLLIMYLRRADGQHALFLVMLTATALGIMGPLLLTHFESRYLYQFKLLIIYFALLGAGRKMMHGGTP